MKASELVSELKKVADLFEWTLVPHEPSGEGHERRARPRFRVRGRHKNGPKDLWFEPIGALCYVRTGIAYDEDHWLESAVTLDLSAQDAKDVVAAANDLAWRQMHDRREPHPYRQNLRQSIIEAVGLEVRTEGR